MYSRNKVICDLFSNPVNNFIICYDKAGFEFYGKYLFYEIGSKRISGHLLQNETYTGEAELRNNVFVISLIGPTSKGLLEKSSQAESLLLAFFKKDRLINALLPEFYTLPNCNYRPSDLPNYLMKNINNDKAHIVSWDCLTQNLHNGVFYDSKERIILI